MPKRLTKHLRQGGLRPHDARGRLQARYCAGPPGEEVSQSFVPEGRELKRDVPTLSLERAAVRTKR